MQYNHFQEMGCMKLHKFATITGLIVVAFAAEFAKQPQNVSVLLGKSVIFQCESKGGERIDFWINGTLAADDVKASQLGFTETSIDKTDNGLSRNLIVQTAFQNNNTVITCILLISAPQLILNFSQKAYLLVEKVTIFEPQPEYTSKTITQVGDLNNITCFAKATSISFLINGTSASYQSNHDRGFSPGLISYNISTTSNVSTIAIIQRTLSIKSSVENNNTLISCRAISAISSVEIDVGDRFITLLIVNGTIDSSNVTNNTTLIKPPLIYHTQSTAIALSNDHATSKVHAIQFPPKSTSVIQGKYVNFTCTASYVNEIFFLVNKIPADFEEVVEKGFVVGNLNENNATSVSSLNLTAYGEVSNNNSQIVCSTYFINDSMPLMPITDLSEPVFLRVQGPFAAVPTLYVDWLNSSSANITWSPPYTLPGIYIAGYNLSFTALSNNEEKLIPDPFVRDENFYLWQNTSCAEMTISAYNGVKDGDMSSRLVVPPPNVTIRNNSINIANENVSFSFVLNVSDAIACFYKFKMSIELKIHENDHENETAFYDNVELKNYTNTANNILTSGMITLPANKQYKVQLKYTYRTGKPHHFSSDLNDFEPYPVLNVTQLSPHQSDVGTIKFECKFLNAEIVKNAKGCLIHLLKSDIIFKTGNNNKTNTGDSNVTVLIDHVDNGKYILKGYIIELTNIKVPAYIDDNFKVMNNNPPTTTPSSPSTEPTSTPTPSGESQLTELEGIIGGAVSVGIIIIVLIMIIVVISWRFCLESRRRREVEERYELLQRHTIPPPPPPPPPPANNVRSVPLLRRPRSATSLRTTRHTIRRANSFDQLFQTYKPLYGAVVIRSKKT